MRPQDVVMSDHHNINFKEGEISGNNAKFRGAIRKAKCEISGAQYEIRDTKHAIKVEISGSRYEISGSRHAIRMRNMLRSQHEMIPIKLHNYYSRQLSRDVQWECTFRY